MTLHEHDDDFDLRLAKRQRLLPQFDAELDGPDSDTDRLLIARARSTGRPVELGSPASRTFRGPRWAVPIGIAATLLLSFTLLLYTIPPPVSAPAPAPAISAEADAQANVEAIGERRAAVPLDPESWLRRIELLRSQGLEAETRTELQAFRQQYPDHPVPAALQSLLPAR